MTERGGSFFKPKRETMRTIGIIEEDATPKTLEAPKTPEAPEAPETPEAGEKGKGGKTKGAKTPKDGEGEK